MKNNRIVKLISSIVVTIALAFEQHAAEADLQAPVRILRHTAGTKAVFRLPHDAKAMRRTGLAAESQVAAAAEEAGVPSFYLFPTQYRGTVPVTQFVDEAGYVNFATATADVDELRRRGLYELDQPLYIYARPLEGASELFRLQDPATGSELYTVDATERSQRLAEGWKPLPSLGWTQAIDSTGVGILAPATIKLAAPELEALTAVREFGRELTFGYTNEKIASLEAGSIVYAEKSDALPLGLVHRVDWVTPAGDGGVIVAMSPVDLNEAFEEIHLFLQGAPLAFLSEDQRSGDWEARDCGVGVRGPKCRSLRVEGVFDSTVSKDFFVEWKTNSKGKEGRIAVTGGSSFGVTIEGQYSDSNSCTLNPVAVFVITPHQDYRISLEASGSLVKDKEKALFKPIVGTVPLGGIPVSATFTAWAGYEASAGLSVKATFTEKAQGTAVLRWDKTKKKLDAEICPKSCPSGFRCGPSSKAPSNPCAISATFSGEAAFEGTASVYVRPEVFLHVGALGSGAGPYVEAKLQLQARSERYATELYGQFIPAAGAKMKIGCWEAKAGLTYNPPNGKEVILASIPVAPTGVDASDGKVKGKVAIKWNEVRGASGYDVYRSTSATGTRTKLNAKLLTSTKYEDAVKPPKQYYYWIRAVTGKMASPYSKLDVGSAK